MDKQAIEKTFGVIFAMNELRGIYRENAPVFEFDAETKDRIKKILVESEDNLASIKKGLTNER